MLGRALPTSSPKIKYKTFWLFFFRSIVLFVFFSKKEEERKKKKECQNKFCSFLRVSWSQPSKFGKLIFNRFWSGLCQPVYPELKESHFHPFSVLNIVLWFFIETRRPLRKSKF